MPKLGGNQQICHLCRLGKAHKKSFFSHFEETTYAGDMVHSELSGPLPKSVNGFKYFCTFTDQYTLFSQVAGIVRGNLT